MLYFTHYYGAVAQRICLTKLFKIQKRTLRIDSSSSYYILRSHFLKNLIRSKRLTCMKKNLALTSIKLSYFSDLLIIYSQI